MRNFLNGVLAGSVLGAVIGLMINESLQPEKKRLIGRTKRFSRQATGIIENMGNTVMDNATSFIRRK